MLRHMAEQTVGVGTHSVCVCATRQRNAHGTLRHTVEEVVGVWAVCDVMILFMRQVPASDDNSNPKK